MSILVDKNTRVLCQGITGKAGQFHTRQCTQYGTQLVGGVTPGRGGQTFEGLPIFDTVAEAVAQTGADATMIFVPPPFAADAILEAADAGIRVIVAITEGVPVLDMARVSEALAARKRPSSAPTARASSRPVPARSASCPAISTSRGPIGADQPLRHADLRGGLATDQLGPGPVDLRGHRRRPDRRQLLRRPAGTLPGRSGDPRDPDDRRDRRHGRRGSRGLHPAARVTKPVAAFIAGRTAPPGRRMGHAGAIISGGRGTAKEKVAALENAGIVVAESPADMARAMQRAMKK